MVDFPRIYLAIDNCFAYKRWTSPADWMKVIKDLGLTYVETSADVECDPLYFGEDYMQDWTEAVRENSAKTGVNIANLYSGHGTYTTLGLAHPDRRIRDRFRDEWLKPMIDIAVQLDAGLGFYCHAFPDDVLQDKERYRQAEAVLRDNLAQLAGYAGEKGLKAIGLEQMYTPHQIPWTIRGTGDLLAGIYQQAHYPFYITIDTGHQTGQRNFLKPGYGQLKELFRKAREADRFLLVDQLLPGLWLGPEQNYQLFEEGIKEPYLQEDRYIQMIETNLAEYEYLFADYRDGDPYLWLEELGCYSSIVHLQQTNGRSSGHLPFTAENNKEGIIDGERVIQSLIKSYAQEDSINLPVCDEIFLTLEIFSSTGEKNYDLLKKIEESVEYWRRFIPRDGMKLNQLPGGGIGGEITRKV